MSSELLNQFENIAFEAESSRPVDLLRGEEQVKTIGKLGGEAIQFRKLVDRYILEEEVLLDPTTEGWDELASFKDILKAFNKMEIKNYDEGTNKTRLVSVNLSGQQIADIYDFLHGNPYGNSASIDLIIRMNSFSNDLVEKYPVSPRAPESKLKQFVKKIGPGRR